MDKLQRKRYEKEKGREWERREKNLSQRSFLHSFDKHITINLQ